MLEGVESFLTDHGGMGAFVALILLKVGEMLWSYFRNRNKVTDETLQELKCALEKNTITLNAIQSDLKKFKLDLRRAFHAIRRLSGKDWANISEELRNLRDN
jgi:hypothetical protein